MTGSMIFFILTSLLAALVTAQQTITIGGKDYIVYADMYDRAAAKSLCESNNAQLVHFTSHEQQMEVTGYLYFYDYPYLRAYWTDGKRSQSTPDLFVWETSGDELDQGLKWADGEPSPVFDKNSVYFLAETHGLITGEEIFTHSVICEQVA